MSFWKLLEGDAWKLVETMPAKSVQAVVTSPPYWRQRTYDRRGEFGHGSLESYVESLVRLFNGLAMCLTDDGAAWLNLGDTYDAHRLQMVPARVACALSGAGWILRAEVIYERENIAPESAPNRPTRSHEHVFLLTRSTSYYYDAAYMREPAKYAGYHYKRKQRGPDGRRRINTDCIVSSTRNLRSVWTGPTGWNSQTSHSAVMPRLMAERCVLSVTRPGDIVLDPFAGSGTTGIVALENGRGFIGWELLATHVSEARVRLSQVAPLMSQEMVTEGMDQ